MNQCKSIENLKESKRQLTKLVFNSNNDYIIDSYYKGYNSFKNEINKLNKKSLSLLNIKEIKLLNFINKLSIYDLEFIIKEA